MTDKYFGLFDGAIDERAYVINAIADEQITIGSPVTVVAPAVGELLPRVEPTDSITAYIHGVCVGGDSNGTYGGSSEIAGEAGDAVKVCINGRCKVRVDGSGTPVAIGSQLGPQATDGVAVVAVTTNSAFARALQTSTASTDFIACSVDQEGVVA
ncbi:hypothetical protein LCGC14_0762140 [marine sediment metagenome]|uniref:DUF2190 domain-containing protein n=1 Tax=marine sediment metagenome TaxID=412755 RepID=A0A0F9Q4X3_9ZZZZ